MLHTLNQCCVLMHERILTIFGQIIRPVNIEHLTSPLEDRIS
jgi:hypothetical protein